MRVGLLTHAPGSGQQLVVVLLEGLDLLPIHLPKRIAYLNFIPLRRDEPLLLLDVVVV